MIKIFKKILLVGSFIIFNLIFWQIEVIADESSASSTSNSVNTNTLDQTITAKTKNSSETKNSLEKPENLLGIRTDFIYNNQNDTSNTLRVIVYPIQKEQELYHPVYKADNSKYKVTMDAIFYVGNKMIYKNEYRTDKTGEIIIYLDEIAKVMSQTKGSLRIELEPLTIGKLDLRAMKYHDKVYREFSLPIPSRSDKNLTSTNEQISSEDKTMTSTLVKDFLIGSITLLIGCLIGYIIGKFHGKKNMEAELLKTKFDNIPKIKTEAKEKITSKQLEENTEAKDTSSSAIVPEIEEIQTTIKATAETESTKEQLKKVSGEINPKLILMPEVHKYTKEQPKQTQISKEDIPKKPDITNNTEYSSNDESAMLDQLKSLREHAQKLLSSLDD